MKLFIIIACFLFSIVMFAQAQDESIIYPQPNLDSEDKVLPEKILTTKQLHTAVIIENHKFNPHEITVAKGQSVIWTNKDSVPHTVTFNTGDITSKELSPSDQFEYTFATEGTFPYFCKIHPHMHGAVVVKPSESSYEAVKNEDKDTYYPTSNYNGQYTNRLNISGGHSKANIQLDNGKQSLKNVGMWRLDGTHFISTNESLEFATFTFGGKRINGALLDPFYIELNYSAYHQTAYVQYDASLGINYFENGVQKDLHLGVTRNIIGLFTTIGGRSNTSKYWDYGMHFSFSPWLTRTKQSPNNKDKANTFFMKASADLGFYVCKNMKLTIKYDYLSYKYRYSTQDKKSNMDDLMFLGLGIEKQF